MAYAWQHPEDGPQDGLLVVSSDTDSHEAVKAAWVDSWHQAPAIVLLRGTVRHGEVELSYNYDDGAGWIISFASGTEGDFHLAMYNVVPNAHATTDLPAGPYLVMTAELERA
ncbi:hypothetical protein [Qaidamihabitans albus]|uniref:hypothetical protein n=1 Tax=Qaidamihabitans albus TaxID=2795733 RepID=UPI0018F2476D|nr:hypothetical protein [Qaidamihabitans albus]